MSASNWDICPRCLATAKADLDKASAEVYAQYGKVSADEFDRLRDELPEFNPEDHRTFREDYEFYGAADGEIKATYSGKCSTCGLATKLTTSRRFWPE